MSGKRQSTYLSLRDRLILNFLFFGVVIIVVIGLFSYYTARDVLLDRTFEQLTSVKVMKKRQLENFFADRTREIKYLAASQETNELLELASMGMPEVNISSEIDRIYGTYLARYMAAQDYYTSYYIVSKEGLVIKIPTSDFKPGKETFMTINENAALESVWEMVLKGDEIAILDLDKRKDEPGLFIGTPLKENSILSGMIVMEISIEAVNKIMYENNPYEGLGESGESYLVGADLLMRSISRFRDNSILNIQVATRGVELAFKGLDSTAIINDYREVKVLSSFGTVSIPGLQWAILAEIDLSEALVPLNAIRNNILIISSFIILILFITAYFLSARITSPLIRLKNAAEKIGQGNFTTKLEINLKNEIGDLTQSFNTMTDKLADKTHELERERAKRLRSVLDGQELERQRLSRELHDGLGQRVIALKLKLENINSPEKCDTLGMIKEIKGNFDETIDEIRRMSNDLMPAVLYEFGLTTALRTLMDSIPGNLGMKSHFSATGKFDDLNKTTKTYLYRIAQEAVYNAIKHSAAKLIMLDLNRNENEITLSIVDNGKGFDYKKDTALNGNGLYNMRERAGLLNGKFVLRTEEQQGTSVIITISQKPEK